MSKRDDGAACVYVIDKRPAHITDDEAWDRQKIHYLSTACYHGYPDRCRFLWEYYETDGPNYMGFIYLEKACENGIVAGCGPE